LFNGEEGRPISSEKGAGAGVSQNPPKLPTQQAKPNGQSGLNKDNDPNFSTVKEAVKFIDKLF
ncbi:MAG: hypothetical protein ACE5IR_24580, partial [bacterium]